MENYKTTDCSIYSRNKKIAVAIAVAMLVITSPTALIFGEKSSTYLIVYYVTAIITNVLVFVWCFYDALERNQPLEKIWRFLIIIFGIFALLAYLFKTRGFIQGIKAIGICLLIFLLASIGSGVILAMVSLIIGEK